MVFLFFAAKGIAQVPFEELDISRHCDPNTDMCIQAPCDDIPRTRITTHPDHPVNVFNPARRNLFDWRTQRYPIAAVVGSPLGTVIKSPFWQDDNGNVSVFSDLDRKDMRPEDGWEVLKYDFGGVWGTSHHIADVVDVPYLVLYNRFLGKMRVFAARGPAYGVNYANIYVAFQSPNKSSLLDLHHGLLRPLDMPFVNGQLQAGVRVLNLPREWSYADFPMIYDPCTCEYDRNSLLISINNVVLDSVNFRGTIEGTIASRSGNNLNTNVEGDGISFQNVKNFVNNYFVKSYSLTQKLIDDSKKVIDNTSGVGSDSVNIQRKKEALNQLGQILNGNSGSMRALRSGLRQLPYLTTALSLYDMFTAGGTSSGPQKVEIMPMVLNANVNLNGIIKRDINYKDITLSTPGSISTMVQYENYPYYNEVLGVFNLLETPKIHAKMTHVLPELNNWDHYAYGYQLSLSKPVKYVINPASGLEVQDVQAAFVVRNRDRIGRTNFPNIINDKMATTAHVDLFTATPIGEVETSYIPDGVEGLSTLKDQIWIQLILNLRRKDGQGENVLLTVTYPTTFTDNATICKNCFERVSQPEIRKFCTDSKSIYRENRILAKEKPVETEMQSTIQRFKAFPNPVDNLLHINFDSETEQTVKAWLTDVTGRVVSAILEQKTGKGNSNLDLPTHDLPEGLHLFVFEVNGIKKVQKVVIRH